MFPVVLKDSDKSDHVGFAKENLNYRSEFIAAKAGAQKGKTTRRKNNFNDNDDQPFSVGFFCLR
jgi:hypothetical protein